MPWYKLEYHFGPGHQSHHIEYVWKDKPLTDKEQSSLLEDWWEDSQYSFSSQCSGEAEEVDELPEKEHESLVRRYEGRIELSLKMLDVLKNTKKVKV